MNTEIKAVGTNILNTVKTAIKSTVKAGRVTRVVVDKIDKLIRIVITTADLNEQEALFVAGFILSKCPFERDIILPWGSKFHIPALCKLNPYYIEVVALKVSAISKLLSVYNYTYIDGELIKGTETSNVMFENIIYTDVTGENT